MDLPKEINDVVGEYEEGSFRLTNSNLSLTYKTETFEDDDESGDIIEVDSSIQLPASPGIWIVRWCPPVYLLQASYRILLIYRYGTSLEKLPTNISIPREEKRDDEYEKIGSPRLGNFLLCSNQQPLLDIESWGNGSNYIMIDHIQASKEIIAIPIRRISITHELRVWREMVLALIEIGRNPGIFRPLWEHVDKNKYTFPHAGKIYDFPPIELKGLRSNIINIYNLIEAANSRSWKYPILKEVYTALMQHRENEENEDKMNSWDLVNKWKKEKEMIKDLFKAAGITT